MTLRACRGSNGVGIVGRTSGRHSWRTKKNSDFSELFVILSISIWESICKISGWIFFLFLCSKKSNLKSVLLYKDTCELNITFYKNRYFWYNCLESKDKVWEGWKFDKIDTFFGASRKRPMYYTIFLAECAWACDQMCTILSCVLVRGGPKTRLWCVNWYMLFGGKTILQNWCFVCSPRTRHIQHKSQLTCVVHVYNLVNRRFIFTMWHFFA